MLLSKALKNTANIRQLVCRFIFGIQRVRVYIQQNAGEFNDRRQNKRLQATRTDAHA